MDLSQPPRIRAIGRGTCDPAWQSHWHGLSFWCLHCYDYEAELSVDGRRYTLRPGSISLVAPRTDIRYRWSGRVSHHYAHFDLEPAASSSSLAPVPECVELGSRSGIFANDFAAAVGWQASCPARARARLWDLLWRLGGEDAAGDRCSRARAHIASHLARIHSVALLARELGVSHNTLTRCFQREHGCTVQGYLRRARAERARHLLAVAGMSPRQAAAEVGVGDAQTFNKLLRRELGCGPRAVRQLG